jgi:hypothetical protein
VLIVNASVLPTAIRDCSRDEFRQCIDEISGGDLGFGIHHALSDSPGVALDVLGIFPWGRRSLVIVTVTMQEERSHRTALGVRTLHYASKVHEARIQSFEDCNQDCYPPKLQEARTGDSTRRGTV